MTLTGLTRLCQTGSLPGMTVIGLTVKGADGLLSAMPMTTLPLFGASALLNADSSSASRSARGGCCFAAHTLVVN